MKYLISMPKTPYKSFTGRLDFMPDAYFEDGYTIIDVEPTEIRKIRRHLMLLTGNVEITETDKCVYGECYGFEEEDFNDEYTEDEEFEEFEELDMPEPVLSTEDGKEIELEETFEQMLIERGIEKPKAKLARRIIRDEIKLRKDQVQVEGVTYSNISTIREVLGVLGF